MVQESSNLHSSATVRSNLSKDLSSIAKFILSKDIGSGVLTNLINTLDIIYSVSSIEEYRGLDSKAAVSYFMDMLASAMVRTWESHDLSSVARVAQFTDLLSNSYVPHGHDLSSNTTIPESSVLDIVYKLIQAPIETLPCNLIQDAYIREYRPTLNYGGSSSLILGNAMEGSYNFVAQFDVKPYNELMNAHVLGGDIVLQIIGAYNPAIDIEAYVVSNVWNESTITWSNFNPSLIKKIATFKCTTSTIRIPILEFLNELRSSGTNNFSVYFKVDSTETDLFYFHSKESSTISSRPRLEILYQDLAWNGFIDSTNLNGLATIKVANARDIHSTATLRETRHADLDSKVNIQLSVRKDLNSNVIIRQHDNMDLSSSAFALPNTNMDSVAIIRQTEYRDINSNSNIFIASNLNGSAEVKTFFSWMSGKAIIRRSDFAELEGTVSVRHNIDLESIANLRRKLEQDLSSKARFRVKGNSDLGGTVNIRQLTELSGSAVLQRQNWKDLSSTAKSRWRSETDLNSFIQVRGSYYELSSTGTVRRKTNNDLRSLAYSAYATNLDSIAVIKSQILGADLDLASTVKVRRRLNTDLTSTAQLHVFKDLASTVLSRLSSFKDLPSSIKVRAVTDLISRILVYQVKDLNSVATVRRTATTDLISDAIIRQFDIIEIDSKSYLYGMHIVDLINTVMIQNHGIEFLDGKATIHSTARRWVPNVHGQDIFTFEDRKLPRVWIRENFIP